MATGTTIPNVRRQTKQFAPIEAQIQRAIARIADSDCPVLIMGEHGVGKRSIAAQIHSQSHRSRSAYTEIHIADADVLLTQYSKQFDRPKPVLQEEIIGFLMEHTWPENLSELQTAIKTFVAIGDQSVSLAALKAAASSVKSNGQRRSFSLKDAARAASTQIERQLISEVLAANGGNRKRAADELGISYKALLYKLKQVGAEDQPASNRNGVAV